MITATRMQASTATMMAGLMGPEADGVLSIAAGMEKQVNVPRSLARPAEFGSSGTNPTKGECYSKRKVMSSRS